MKRTKTRALTEGAIMVALATALSYVKFFELPNGGSVCIGMVPILIYCIRWGWKDGFLATFAMGLLQLIFDGAYAWGPWSMLLDYLLAYGVLGVAGFFWKRKSGLFTGTVVACICRFIIHFISGITIYKIYEPTEVLNHVYTNAVRDGAEGRDDLRFIHADAAGHAGGVPDAGHRPAGGACRTAVCGAGRRTGSG